MRKPKWITGDISNRERSDKKVKKSAKKFGGRATPNSGATKIKGDYVLKKFLVEHKFTDKASYRIDDRTWQKAVEEAWLANREAVLEIETATGHYFVVAPHVFEKLLEDTK